MIGPPGQSSRCDRVALKLRRDLTVATIEMLELDLSSPDLTVPASPRAKRLPPGSRVPVPLARVRKDVGLLPSDLKSPSLTLDQINSLESHNAIDLSALAAYVQALGGHLDVAVVFGVRRYPLDLSPEALAAVEPDCPSEEF